MALKPTIFKAKIALSDFNRDYYDDIHLTIAQHPSETVERMIVRIIAYCLNADSQLDFTKGLSATDEPDLWLKTLDDQLALWIDVGEPAADRIKKASRRANAVKVYSFNSKSDVWWRQEGQKFSTENNEFFQLQWEQVQALLPLVGRTMQWSVTITENNLYIADDHLNCELSIKKLTV